MQNLTIEELKTSVDSLKSENEALNQLFFKMKVDITDLKTVFLNLVSGYYRLDPSYLHHLAQKLEEIEQTPVMKVEKVNPMQEDQCLSLPYMEKQYIIKALEKYKGKRKDAAIELCISERTLYRKLKEHNLEQY